MLRSMRLVLQRQAQPVWQVGARHTAGCGGSTSMRSLRAGHRSAVETGPRARASAQRVVSAALPSVSGSVAVARSIQTTSHHQVDVNMEEAMPAPRKLEYSGVLIADAGAHAIAEELRQNEGVRELAMTSCVIPDTSVMILAEAVLNSHHLDSLLLVDNIVSDWGNGMLGSAFASRQH